MNIYSKIILISSILVSPSALAGDYVKFCDKDKLKALEGALTLAERAVKSQRSGCVGLGKHGEAASISYPDENGEKCVGVFKNNTNGACGIKKTPGEMLKDLGL